MCRFILWMIVFLYAIGYSEAQQSITAIQGIIYTRNYQTATFEWVFHFPDSSLIFLEILMVDKDNVKQKGIVFKTIGGQFQAYDNMKDRVKISIPPSRQGVTLDISNIVISDGGRYECTARLRSGKEISNISLLVVIVPPRINKFQRKVYRDEGFNASLLCQLDAGSPRPLNFQWFRMVNGVKVVATPVVQRDSNQTFYIPNVGRPSLGKYRCEVGGLGGVDIHTVDLFVRYKPVITAPPLNRTVLEKFGTEQLRCTADGNAGATTYHWYKDHPFPANEIIRGSEPKGIQIAQDRRALKFIRPPRKLDAMYFCTGSNLLGMGKPKGAHLNVTYKPGDIEILTTEGVINGIEGENMTVNSFSDANPPAYYNWYKIVKTWWGSTIREHIVKYSYTGDLKLYRVDKNDTAKYICIAANRPNDEDRDREYYKEKTVTINVRYGPRQTNFTINDFNQSHSYIEVKQYEKVTIRCVSHSEPGADYNIRREKVMTQLNRNTKVGVYVIERIETSQEGVYVCISSNAITKKHEKLKIRLIVAVAPVKVDPYPGSKTVQEGATLSIDCHAKGKPPPKVYWQRYGANITHNDSVIQTNYMVRPLKEGILSIVDAELKFTGIRYTDDASYSCIMWNAGGQINLTRIRYVVQYTPKLTKRPENFTRTEGKKARFVCQAKGNPETIQWTWKFNDVEVPRISTNTFLRSFTNRDDNGKYECVPRNSVGNGQIGTGYLQVQYEPEFTVKPEKNYTVDVSQRIVLRCEAKAVPTPQIRWIKYLGDGIPVRTGNVFTINSIKPEDRGQYNCIASNVIRSVSTKTLIIVRHKPIITTRKPSDTKVGSEDGAQVTLRCDVDAYPTATVQWKDFIDKTLITHGSDYHITEEATLFGKRSTLRFTVHSYQLGKDYICSAKNNYGTDSVRYQVLVKGKPDPPEEGSLKAVDYLIPTIPVTVNINFTWNPGYNGGYEVDFYLLYREKQESRFREEYMGNRIGFKYVFKNRKAGASYVFSMKAKNRVGISDRYQPPLEFSTKVPPPDVANVTIERVGQDGSAVRISWNIIVKPSKRLRREIENRWDYGVVRYKIADIDTEWKEEKILKIPTRGSYLVEDLEPEQLYVFHFILFDKSGYFGRPMLIGTLYPRYGPALPSRSDLSKTDIIAIGVGCGGAILIVSLIVLIIAICKKKKKPAYGIASYGNGRTRVDIPVSATMKSGGYGGDVVRASFLKDDEDPLAVDSSGLDEGDKSPPPDYNAIHYSVPPRDKNLNQSSFSEDQSPSYTTFGRVGKDPQFGSKDDGLGEPLLRKSINDLDDGYQKVPERSHGQHRNSRGRLSSDEEVHDPPPLRPPPPEEEVSNRVPGAFGDRAQRFKKPPYRPYDEENGSISPPNQIGSGRQSPNGSSVASSKPYRSDNEYIEEAEENYVGYLV